MPSSRNKAQRILKFAKVTAEWGSAPSAAEVDAQDQDRMLAADDWQTEIAESERAAVDQLVTRFAPEQLAAAYLRQYKTRHSAPEELSAVSMDKPKPRAPFGPSVWFSLSEGRNQNASPRHLLPMICKAGGLTKDDIGGIRIADDMSYVEIRKDRVDEFLASVGPGMKIEGTKDVVQLDQAPDVPAFKHSKPERGAKGGPNRRKGDTKPVDWNDAPAPRQRKPKPEDRKPRKSRHAKPAGEAVENDAIAPLKSRKPASNGPKPKGQAKGSEGRKPDRAEGKPKGQDGPRKPRSAEGKGPPPPKGKPSSKKNRARAAARKAAKGGNAPPKRR